MYGNRSAFGIAAALLLSAAVSDGMASAVESYVVTIDAQTTQPVGTGFVPTTTAGSIIVLSEGTIQGFDDPTRYTAGWVGPNGESRQSRAGQPIVDGMTWGALLGGFSASVPTYQALGRVATKSIQTGNVGNEFRVALNITEDEETSFLGSVTVTVIYVPDGTADEAHVTIQASSPRLVPTGLTAEEGYRWLVLPYGMIRQSTITSVPFTSGWFDAAGRALFNRTGQVLPEGPYGALLGTYGVEESAFHIGDGGTWNSQPSDYGHELMLLPNLSAADEALLDGRLTVSVLRLAAPAAAVGEDEQAAARGLSVAPNPTSGGSTIRYELPSSSATLVRVSDINGRWVRKLVNEWNEAGWHSIEWDGRDDAGRALPNGAYFYQVSSAEGSRVGRVIISR